MPVPIDEQQSTPRTCRSPGDVYRRRGCRERVGGSDLPVTPHSFARRNDPMQATKSNTPQVPGATLYHEVRGSGSQSEAFAVRLHEVLSR